jgi:hypothetical protein
MSDDQPLLARGIMSDEIASYVRETSTPEIWCDPAGRPVYLLYNTEGGVFLDAAPAGRLPILLLAYTAEDGEKFMTSRGRSKSK